ncbi:MAG: hypothetical protein JSV94_05790 [Methanobacteriota archaeon]|nr:MAG: hypothetical protein JSV94_05790 [Euryarchaeota archaeon]
MPTFDTGGESYETAERIDNLDTSYAFYGELPRMTPGSPVGAKYYTFEGKNGQEFEFEIGVRDMFFPPCLLLVGPGLPSPDEDAQNIIESGGLSLPDGQGALGWYQIFLPWASYYAWECEFEPFTQTHFFSPTYYESVILPSDGRYHLILTSIVYSEQLGDYQIRPGKYFLVTGHEEEFTLADFVLMPWYWLKVRSFWSEHGEVLFIWPTVAVLAGLLAAEAFRNRKDESFRNHTRLKQSLYYGGLTGSFLMIGGAVNQLSLLMIHTSNHDWEGIVMLVLTLQLGALVLGIVSASYAKKHFFELNGTALTVAVVIAIFALLIGAGLIIGPLLFMGCLAIVMLVNHVSDRVVEF